jgi:hypothetical protein
MDPEVMTQRWSREELERAHRHYVDTAARCAASGQWRPWADLFTDDAVYLEHTFGARDPRASLCVDDERPPFSFVVVEGVVELTDDLDVVRGLASRIGARYMGAARADEYGARNGVPGELAVRLNPVRVTSAKDLAD